MRAHLAIGEIGAVIRAASLLQGNRRERFGVAASSALRAPGVDLLRGRDVGTVQRAVVIFRFMLPTVHPSFDELEAYSLGLASDASLDKVEEHLLICEQCRIELTLSDQYVRAVKKAVPALKNGKRLRSIHTTDDGPIFGTIHSGADGKWIARQWGRQLDGGRTCDSMEEANAYLIDSFRQYVPRTFLFGKLPGRVLLN